VNVLVVYCHPDPSSLVAAVRERAVATLERGGHVVHVVDLYADGFDPCLTADERAHHREPGVSPTLQSYADDLRWCDALLLVYPTWWGTVPAMLKGWIDRVWALGVAWDLPAGTSTVRGRLRNIRRLGVVTTYGSPRRVNMVEGEPGKRLVKRTLRVLCHPLTRLSWIRLYGVDTATDSRRRAFLDRVESRLSRW
jgi:NAD(P)H dehydrogenase (quinone)